MKTCSVEGCDKEVRARALCSMHYCRWLAKGEIGIGSAYNLTRDQLVGLTVCTIDECGKKSHARGLCQNHYRSWLRKGTPLPRGMAKDLRKDRLCKISDCTNRVFAYSFCHMHYSRAKHGASLEAPKRKKMARSVGKNGYATVYEPTHPNAMAQGRVREHIKVMSEILGRPLTRDERVHHLNGVRYDNRPENLELWSISHPSGQRVKDKIEWAKEILNLYANYIS